MTHHDNNTRKVHSDIISLKYVYKYYELSVSLIKSTSILYYSGVSRIGSYWVFYSARIDRSLAKPELQRKITEQLLKAEEVPVPTSECRNILIGKAMTAFNVYFNQIEDKDKVISFVKRQLSNSRNATKTKAERFLRKLDMSR
jgi:hypothetical protein